MKTVRAATPVILLVSLIFAFPFVGEGSPPSVQAYFECFMQRDFSNIAHLQRISDLSENEIYRLGWLVSSVRPLSAWRFSAGEIVEIRRFADRYEVTFRLPVVKGEHIKSGLSECLYYDEARQERRSWTEEKRILPIVNGMFPRRLFDELEKALLTELEQSLEGYLKLTETNSLMETLIIEATLDTGILGREKALAEQFMKKQREKQDTETKNTKKKK